MRYSEKPDSFDERARLSARPHYYTRPAAEENDQSSALATRLAFAGLLSEMAFPHRCAHIDRSRLPPRAGRLFDAVC
jgi:hypothetical protein